MKRTSFFPIFVVLTVTAAMVSGCIGQNNEQTSQPITLIQKSGSGMVQELETGTIDAMISWEPWNAEAVLDGYGYTLINSSDLWPHHPCCVLAADDTWYRSTVNADEILERVALAHLKATEWINAAMSETSENHTALISYAMNFTLQSADVVSYAFDNIDFDYTLDYDGINTYAAKLVEYGIFQQNKWSEAGYGTTEAYVNQTLNNTYIDWAIAHENDDSTTLALETPVSLRIGYLTSDLHQLAMYVALQEGFYEQYNINVSTRGFSNGADEMDTGFKLNTIDIGYLGIAPALIRGINNNDFTSNDATIHVIAGVNYNGSAIVVRDKSIDSIAKLAGKTVAYPGQGTVQYFIMLLAANESSLQAIV